MGTHPFLVTLWVPSGSPLWVQVWRVGLEPVTPGTGMVRPTPNEVMATLTPWRIKTPDGPPVNH